MLEQQDKPKKQVGFGRGEDKGNKPNKPFLPF